MFSPGGESRYFAPKFFTCSFASSYGETLRYLNFLAPSLLVNYIQYNTTKAVSSCISQCECALVSLPCSLNNLLFKQKTKKHSLKQLCGLYSDNIERE